MKRLEFPTRILLIAALAACVPAWADDVPADYEERARLLEQLLRRDRVPAAPAVDPAALPGAKLDAQTQYNRQQLQLQRSGDQAYRQLLGEQQSETLRSQLSGVPSNSAQTRALGLQQEQRGRDLSMRILQQDQQYRFDSRSRR